MFILIHITRIFYTEICLISKDVLKEMNVLLCSRYDKLKTFVSNPWLTIINIELIIDILSVIFDALLICIFILYIFYVLFFT